MRVVLDANVPVAAVRSRRGASNAILVGAVDATEFFRKRGAGGDRERV